MREAIPLNSIISTSSNNNSVSKPLLIDNFININNNKKNLFKSI